MGSRKTLIVLSLFATIFVVVFAGAFALSQAEKFVASQARRQFAKLKPQLEVDFKSVKINPFTRMLIFNGIEVRSAAFPETVKVRAAGAGNVDWGTIIEIAKTQKPIVPRHFSFAIFGLEVPSAWTGGIIDSHLRSLGYDTLTVDLRLGLNLDVSKNDVAIEPLILSMENAGRFDFTLALQNAKIPTKADFDLLKKNPKQFVVERLPDYGDVSIREISIRYQDDSFIERATRWLVENGEDHPVALANLALEQPAGQRKVAQSDGPTFARTALVALRDFLEKPGSIAIRTALPKPVTFSHLLDEKSGGSIEELAKKLALQVERD